MPPLDAIPIGGLLSLPVPEFGKTYHASPAYSSVAFRFGGFTIL
jgi:hypothetical protein